MLSDRQLERLRGPSRGKEIPPVVAAVDNVVVRAGKLDAESPCHRANKIAAGPVQPDLDYPNSWVITRSVPAGMTGEMQPATG